MSQENIEFRWLDWKVVGSDTVVFRLEDDTVIKARITLTKAGVSVKLGPNNQPTYIIEAQLLPPIVVPKNRRFYAPPPPTPPQIKKDTGIGIEPTRK